MSTTYTKIATMPWHWNDYGALELSEEQIDRHERYIQEELEKYGEYIYMDGDTNSVYNLIDEPKVEINWDSVLDKAWNKLCYYWLDECAGIKRD